MQNQVLYPANMKFQPKDHVVDSFTDANLQAGKSFEREFLTACRKVRRTERLVDRRYNKPSCDHYAVFSPSSKLPLPGMLTFFECKSTGCADLPLIDIKPHQLEAMDRYDHAFLGAYAGFVIHYRDRAEEEVWYMPGKVVQEYVDQDPYARYLPSGFVKERGIPIQINAERPKTRLCNRLDIRSFLAQLSRT